MRYLYTDSSALLKRYFIEASSELCQEIIANYSNLCISSLGIAEVLITLKRRLGLLDSELAVRIFEADLAFFTIVDFNREIGREAVEVSGGKNLATLDSIHIASALRFKNQDITFLTFDRAQALAARRNGLKTLGVLS